MDLLQILTSAYGEEPVATGAGVKTFSVPAWGFEAWENTTFSEFRDKDDNVVVTGWENVQIDSGRQAIFGGSGIKKATVTDGGRGKIIKMQV